MIVVTNEIKPEVLALIPARSGSKGVPDKNVRVVAGKPLLGWSVEQARSSELVSRTIVSSDSEAYLEIARQFGAETPFKRPAAFAGDSSTDLEVFRHALDWLDDHEDYRPELVVHLRPTCPVRPPGLIDAVIGALLARPQIDSVRTIAPVQHPPFKMWHRGKDGMLEPVKRLEGVAEPWNEPRQRLPDSFIQTANVDVVRAAVIRERGSMTGERIFGFLESRFFDIDTEDELLRAERALRMSQPGTLSGAAERTFCFDIDGIVATITPDNNYALAGPIRSNIDLINALHQAGHRIILFTARGSATGKDWQALTRRQMRSWGVRHHELLFGKPAADYYIDDKMLTPGELEQLFSLPQKYDSEAQ